MHINILSKHELSSITLLKIVIISIYPNLLLIKILPKADMR